MYKQFTKWNVPLWIHLDSIQGWTFEQSNTTKYLWTTWQVEDQPKWSPVKWSKWMSKQFDSSKGNRARRVQTSILINPKFSATIRCSASVWGFRSSSCWTCCDSISNCRSGSWCISCSCLSSPSCFTSSSTTCPVITSQTSTSGRFSDWRESSSGCYSSPPCRKSHPCYSLTHRHHLTFQSLLFSSLWFQSAAIFITHPFSTFSLFKFTHDVTKLLSSHPALTPLHFSFLPTFFFLLRF